MRGLNENSQRAAVSRKAWRFCDYTRPEKGPRTRKKQERQERTKMDGWGGGRGLELWSGSQCQEMKCVCQRCEVEGKNKR